MIPSTSTVPPLVAQLRDEVEELKETIVKLRTQIDTQAATIRRLTGEHDPEVVDRAFGEADG